MTKGLVLAVAATAMLSVGGFAVYASALQQDTGDTLTGCINPGGELKHVAVGNTPDKPCAKNETLVRLGNGDITAVNTPTAGGLSGGSDSGEATLSIQPSFRLPQGCHAPNVVAKWLSGAWACAADENTTYNGGDFALSNQACASGKFVDAIDASGHIKCSSAIVLTQLAKGNANCAEGGLAVGVGADVYYVCNGTPGAAGAPGAPGGQGGVGSQGPPGPSGPPGSVNNASSGNGLFRISLTNAGLVLKGPGGTITIDRSAVVVHGTPYANVEGSTRP
jgi:hypothetical protein